jgi:hypothetical protein
VARLMLMSSFLVPLLLALLAARARGPRRALGVILGLMALFNLIYVFVVSSYFLRIAP